jgi:hypothetical protein
LDGDNAANGFGNIDEFDGDKYENRFGSVSPDKGAPTPER